MKVQLIYPNPDTGFDYSEGVHYPVGLLSIASQVRKFHPEIDIEILNGPIIGTQDDLEKRINGAVVGITVNSLNYGNVLRVAKVAKSKGAKVIVGGPHSTAVGEKILQYRPFIDAAVRQDGEEAFLAYLENRPLEGIPNLIYRKNNAIITNPVTIKNLGLHSDLDFELLEIEKYFSNHKKVLPDMPERTMVFFTHFGCKWREQTGGCSFCSIPQMHERLPPREMWKRIEKLKEKYGIQGIRDYGDDFISDKEWVKELIRTRPKSLDDFAITGIYASPRYLTEEMADLLKKLNVKRVFLGFESGNDGILKLANKGCTAKQNYAVAKRLAKRDIEILASYVLGLEGESEKTLNDTYNLAKKIANLGTTRVSGVGIILTYPGTPIFRKLVEKVPKHRETDLFNIEKVRKDWIKYFCNFNTDVESAYELLKDMTYKIGDLSPLKTYLGIKPPTPAELLLKSIRRNHRNCAFFPPVAGEQR